MGHIAAAIPRIRSLLDIFFTLLIQINQYSARLKWDKSFEIFGITLIMTRRDDVRGAQIEKTNRRRRQSRFHQSFASLIRVTNCFVQRRPNIEAQGGTVSPRLTAGGKLGD